jgi:hypothetical protein
MSEEAAKIKAQSIREKTNALTLAQQESFRAWSIAHGFGNPYQQLEAAAFERGRTAGRVEQARMDAAVADRFDREIADGLRAEAERIEKGES